VPTPRCLYHESFVIRTPVTRTPGLSECQKWLFYYNILALVCSIRINDCSIRVFERSPVCKSMGSSNRNSIIWKTLGTEEVRKCSDNWGSTVILSPNYWISTLDTLHNISVSDYIRTLYNVMCIHYIIWWHKTSKTLLVAYTVYAHKLSLLHNTTSTQKLGILVVLLQSNAACLL